MNIETSAFMCHGCKRKGNSVTFLAEYENISILLATRFLHERYGGVGSDPDAYSARVELQKLWDKNAEENQLEEEDQILDETLIDRYATDWSAALVHSFPPGWVSYTFDRGFTPKILEEWEIGYCERKDRIVIPVRNESGGLVGFKARAWRDQQKPKYLVLGSGEWERYHVSRNIFGLNYADGDHFILVEGELNVVALHQMGIKNCVAVNGSNFSERQAFLLKQYAEQVTVFFDSDESGDIGTNMVCEALRDHMPVFVVPDHEFDAADCINPDKEADEESVRALLQDAESEIKIRLAAREAVS